MARFASKVSMKSGLDGRNNCKSRYMANYGIDVSMKSGLDGRNNFLRWECGRVDH